MEKWLRKKKLIPGLLLLFVPLIHLLIVSLSNSNLENKLVGKYKYGNISNALGIYDNSEFELKKTALYTQSGKGTWKTQTIDFPILMLDFENEGSTWLEISNSNNKIFLSSIGSDRNFTIGFEKISTLNNRKKNH